MRLWSMSAALVALVLVAVAPEASGGGGTPITTCGQTVTTSAFLTQDLVCTGDGIVVGAPAITIDLKGFTIRGDGGAGDYGIDATNGFSGGLNALTIKNGVVRNFEEGIFAFNADGVRVQGVVASGNAQRGIRISGDLASITKSTADGNHSGIAIDGDSASVTSSDGSANATGGIIIGGASASVRSSTASGNDDGIRLTGVSASVKSSIASGNADGGILLSGDSALIMSSTASGNGGEGIFVLGGSASITRSTAAGNATNGVHVLGDSASVASSIVSGNSGEGIVVDGDLAALNRNQTEANGFPDGLSDQSGLGIHAMGFTTSPVGTNVARGNDDPAECNPASLC